jgi:prepilin-type N-terminal cleavage/methylation domain-containing protein
VSEQRGFTLVEMIIALVTMLVVAGALHSLIVSTQRHTRAQSQRLSLQSNVRAGSLVVANELRELGAVAGGTPEQNDILGMGPSAITYRAMRGLGFVCRTPAAAEIHLRRNGFSGHRDPQAGRDSAYLLVPDTVGGAGHSWLPLAITRVTTSGECPADQGAAISLSVPSPAAIAGLEAGTPVRIAETMELRLYRSERLSWLGARSVSAGEAIQPVVGPLAEEGGFGLQYLNGFGIATTDPTSIRSIRVTLRGIVEGATGNLEEQLTTEVSLRNAWHP